MFQIRSIPSSHFKKGSNIMDFMNLFSKVGKEIIEEENKRESSFKESEELNAGLSVDYIAELEDLKRSIVTLAKKIGNAAISNELGIPLDKLRDWTYQYANSLRLYRDSEKTCEDDKVISSNKVVITKLGEESLTDTTLEPIQDEKGILSFVINFDKYTLNVNSEEAREDCIRKLKMLTGADFAWFKEERGLKHWVLYNTKMYEVIGENMFNYEHLRYCHEYGPAPTLPFNATSCYKMFNLYDKVENLNFSNFRTSHVVDMRLMFANWTRVKNIDLSTFNTENVSDFCAMFNGCSNVQFINVSNFKTPKVENMSYMFTGCVKLLELSITGFSKENLQKVDGMFADCMSLAIINANYKFDLSMLSEDATAQPMFKDCVNLTGFSPEYTGIEMAKPKTEGGYFTPKGRKLENVSLMDL